MEMNWGGPALSCLLACLLSLLRRAPGGCPCARYAAAAAAAAASEALTVLFFSLFPLSFTPLSLCPCRGHGDAAAEHFLGYASDHCADR